MSPQSYDGICILSFQKYAILESDDVQGFGMCFRAEGPRRFPRKSKENGTKRAGEEKR